MTERSHPFDAAADEVWVGREGGFICVARASGKHEKLGVLLPGARVEGFALSDEEAFVATSSHDENWKEVNKLKVFS